MRDKRRQIKKRAAEYEKRIEQLAQREREQTTQTVQELEQCDPQFSF